MEGLIDAPCDEDTLYYYQYSMSNPDSLYNLFNIITVILLVISLLLFMPLIQIFIHENQKRGIIRSVILLFSVILILGLIWIFELERIVFVLSMFFVLAAIIFLIPIPAEKNIVDRFPLSRMDERDIVFSRNELVQGTERFIEYYARNPKNRIPDDLFRRQPGLLKKGTIYYHKSIFGQASNNFKEVDLLHDKVSGKTKIPRIPFHINGISSALKETAKDLGALYAGIARTESYHFYSHKGRGEEYGNEISPTHKFAIAFTVEMDHEMVNASPQAPIVLESSKQYLNAGRIAVDLAEKIRALGYDARAHIDGNYQLICPLVARDAGLGEIGRMGLLMTPTHGPRVRLGVVTTELELLPDNYTRDDSVLEFCKICKKCANCCPGGSISRTNPAIIDGVKRWQIDQESCYTFWCKAGTDCGRCMAVCPYSHPNHGIHKFIRLGIRKSLVFRYTAVLLDDFFYGKRPKPRKIPEYLGDKSDD